MDNIFCLICGIAIGNGIRIFYYLLTNKDIPLLKHSYKTYPNGNIEEENHE